MTVDGSGSRWTNNSDLFVGYSGSGSLTITNGGSVSVTGTTYVGVTGTGAIDFGDNGGTLTTASLLASPAQMTGTGTINTCQFVSDVNLVLDSAESLKSTIVLNNLAGQNITLNFDLSSVGSNASLGVGYQAAGSLAIRNGVCGLFHHRPPGLQERLDRHGNCRWRRFQMEQ